MDTRVGYPNEHLAGDSDSDITSPLYATAVGLVLDGLERQNKDTDLESDLPKDPEPPVDEPPHPIPQKKGKGFLEKLTERVKDFLENAE